MRRETDVRSNKLVTGTADLWGFLAFSHGWTWLFWGILIASDLPMWESPTAVALLALGGIDERSS